MQNACHAEQLVVPESVFDVIDLALEVKFIWIRLAAIQEVNT